MNLENQLTQLSVTNNWRGIINIFSDFDISEKSKFLWAWPTLESLKYLGCFLNENHIDTILSIGCGSGLLEWVIHRAIKVDVIGLELDNSWWKSPYAPRTFIDLQFLSNENLSSKTLSEYANRSSECFALMFCYFNDREAFLNYVRAYNGTVIVIIGPLNNVNIVTDPMPLNPMFETDEWTRVATINMQGHDNCMAIYKKKTCDC